MIKISPEVRPQMDEPVGQIPRIDSAAAEMEAMVRLQAAALDSAANAIVITDRHGTIQWVNTAFTKLTGYTASEAIGQNPRVLKSGKHDDQFYKGMWTTVVSGGVWRGQVINRRKDGNLYFEEMTITPVRTNGEIGHFVSVKEDISERKQAERAQARLAAIVESSEDAIISKSLDGVILSWNQSAERLFGYSAEEAVGKPITLIIPPECAEEERAFLERLRRGERIDHCETVRVAKDGRKMDVALVISPILDAFGKVIAISKNIRDVTGRRQAEEALRESEQRSRVQADRMAQLAAELEARKEQTDFALQAAGLGEWSLDLESKNISRSLRHDQIFGYSSLLPRWTYAMFLEHVLPEYRDEIDERFKNALADTGIWEFEAPIRWPDGSIHWVADRARVVYDSSGTPVQLVGISTDITERKRAETALIRSEKLASVGRLATTIAHEINNPLATTMNALYLIKTDPALPDVLKSNLAVAEQELGRVAHITKQTLGFYREIGAPTSVELTDVLDSIVTLYASRLKNKNISLRSRYRTNFGVRAIDGEVRQIASNLIANSIDALPENGVLHVRVFGPEVLRDHRRMIRMTIADNGEGIAKENIKQIFEPFFTTKQSIGTGLGLWVTSELVRKHEGRIRVRSRQGKGTVVTVWLPMERRGQERRYA